MGIPNLHALNLPGTASTALKSVIQNLIVNLHVDVWLDGGWGILTFNGTMSLLSVSPLQWQFGKVQAAIQILETCATLQLVSLVLPLTLASALHCA